MVPLHIMKIRVWHIVFATAMLLSVSTSCSSTRHTSRRSVRTHQSQGRAKKPASHPIAKPVPPNAPVGLRIVAEAQTWLGVPYVYGGETRDGADCSGFIKQVYLEASGIVLPRTTAKQMEHCVPVERESLAPGDILFFKSRNSDGKVAHVGIYSGDGRMIHASSSRGVVEDDLSLDYYVTHYVGAGRSPLVTAATPRPMPPAEPEAIPELPTPIPTPAPDTDTLTVTKPVTEPKNILVTPDSITASPDDIVRRAFMNASSNTPK